MATPLLPSQMYGASDVSELSDTSWRMLMNPHGFPEEVRIGCCGKAPDGEPPMCELSPLIPVFSEEQAAELLREANSLLMPSSCADINGETKMRQLEAAERHFQDQPEKAKQFTDLIRWLIWLGTDFPTYPPGLDMPS